jgi:hypothetical protein
MNIASHFTAVTVVTLMSFFIGSGMGSAATTAPGTQAGDIEVPVHDIRSIRIPSEAKSVTVIDPLFAEVTTSEETVTIQGKVPGMTLIVFRDAQLRLVSQLNVLVSPISSVPHPRTVRVTSQNSSRSYLCIDYCGETYTKGDDIDLLTVLRGTVPVQNTNK